MVWCKTTRNKETSRLALSYIFLWEVTSKLEIQCTKRHACISHLILLGIPSSLVLFVKDWEVGGGGALNGQNQLSVAKVICWRSLKEKISQTSI